MTDEITLHTGVAVPRQLVANIGAWTKGPVTPGWLETIPETVATLCRAWDIALEPGIPETYMTLVLLGHSSVLGPVAIKASPLGDEFRAEATALELAAGGRVARLYDVDLAGGAMVLERIVPGTPLRQVDMPDEAATRLAAESVAAMWRPVADPAGLHPLRAWMDALFAWSPRPGLVPTGMVVRAQETAARLLAQVTHPCLLHGDIQHHNLLRRSSGEWAIIDPKGVYGAPGFDIAAWMYNPPGVQDREDYRELAARRIAVCAEVWGIGQQELAAWAFAGTVLNACWSASGPAPAEWLVATLRVAEWLETLLD